MKPHDDNMLKLRYLLAEATCLIVVSMSLDWSEKGPFLVGYHTSVPKSKQHHQYEEEVIVYIYTTQHMWCLMLRRTMFTYLIFGT